MIYIHIMFLIVFAYLLGEEGKDFSFVNWMGLCLFAATIVNDIERVS